MLCYICRRSGFVYIAFIVNPGEFYVHLNDSKIEEMQEHLHAFYQVLTTNSPTNPKAQTTSYASSN